MEIKRGTLFRCDGCGRESEGGKDYLDLPKNWNYAYFNNLGGGDNEKYDYCSESCFLEELDIRLGKERENRLASFSNKD